MQYPSIDPLGTMWDTDASSSMVPRKRLTVFCSETSHSGEKLQ